LSVEFCQLVMLPPALGDRLLKVHYRTCIPTKVLVARALEACLPTMEKMLQPFPSDAMAEACAQRWNTDGDVPSDNLTGRAS